MTTFNAYDVAQLIEDRTGIAVKTHLEVMLADVLASVPAHALYHDLHRQPDDSPLWQKIIHDLTIGETYFLRDTGQWQALQRYILPQLTDPVRMLSVGCATGEEAYSLAILAQEAGRRATITGLDLNTHALAIARAGAYREWAFRIAPPDFQTQYFSPCGNRWCIDGTLMQSVHFQAANILDGDMPPGNDLILCRNVLLYFSPEAREQAEHLLLDALAADGWLLLGSSETIHHATGRVSSVTLDGVTVYRHQHRSGQAHPRQVPQPLLARPDHYLEAVSAFQRDDLMTARTLLDDLLTHQPNHASGHILYAALSADMQQAHWHLDQALEHHPLDANAHYLRATLYLDAGETKRGQDALKAALYCQRNHPLASYLLGMLMAQSGDPNGRHRLWQNAQRAIAPLTDDSPILDISPMTAGTLRRRLTV